MTTSLAHTGVLPLPIELREDIYDQLSKENYLVLWATIIQNFNGGDYHTSTKPTNTFHTGLLRVSKATRRETLPIFYAEPMFCFRMDFSAVEHSPPPTKEAVSLMENVDLDLVLSNGRVHPTKKSADILKILGMLGGTAVSRNSIRIRLNRFHLPAWSNRILAGPSAFLLALSELSGFKTMVIELRCSWDKYVLADGTPARAMFQDDLPSWNVTIDGCKSSKDWLKHGFEDALGQATESEVADEEGFGYIWFLEFHPRKHSGI